MKPLLRLAGGLLAGAWVGALMGLGVERVPKPAALAVALAAVVAGLISTLLLRNWYPRPEKPSPPGVTAVALLLACYLVVGRVIWANLGATALVGYLASGLVMVLLVYTTQAERPLLGAFLSGGLLGALVVVLGVVVARGPFAPVLDEAGTSAPLIYAVLGLMGAFAGAFAAVAGRASRWGLESPLDKAWKFDEEGRLEAPE
jgi:hypothetical protein